MGRGKEKNVLEYCIDGSTLRNVVGEKGLKKIEEYLLAQNANCPPIQLIDCLEKKYLTHPEGRINDKREEPICLVNMKGDSITPQQRKTRKLFERKVKDRKIKAELICDSYGKEAPRQKKAHKNIKRIEQSPCNKNKKTCIDVPICPCPVGKIIHSDTVAQTDGLHQKKNKKTSIFRRNNACIERKIKSDVACLECNVKELDEKENVQRQHQNMQPQKCNKLLGNRRRRSRTFSLWPRKGICHDEKADPVKITCYKQTDVFDCPPQCKCKMKETSKMSKETTKACHCPPKESNVLYKNICPAAYESKCLIDVNNLKSPIKIKLKSKLPKENTKVCRVCPPKENNVQHKNICPAAYESKSLIDINKLKSLIKCICKKSKIILSKKKPSTHKLTCDPEACERDFMVPTIDKACNQKGEPLIKRKETCKKRHKKLPKQIEINERFIAIPESAGDRTGDIIIRIKDTSKIKKTKIAEKTEICKTIKATPKNVRCQSGEPLQIEVDPINRCVLNPDEIKYQLTHMSQVRKPTCVCPSRKAGHKECEGKICQKMFKDKKNNFNCKCPHIKEVGVVCTDRTCGSKYIKKKYNKCSELCVDSPQLTEPQFVVKLDAKKMCILNSDEINQKIIEKEAEACKPCPGGTCALERARGNTYSCTCLQKKHEDIAECTQRTCVDSDTEGQVDLLYYWMTKLIGKKPTKASSRNRMRRNTFNTNEMRKIKSVFFIIYDRLKRTPEIWDGSEATNKTTCSLSGVKPQQKSTVQYTNYHRRSGLRLPLQTFASNECECKKELQKRKKKKKGKKPAKVESAVKKQLRKEDARKKKLEAQRLAKQEKELAKEMRELEKVDETTETSCVADCILGTGSLYLAIVQCFLVALFKLFTQPKKTFLNIRRWVKSPTSTCLRVQRWFSYRWRIQKFRMNRSIKGSETMTTVLDEARETSVYKTFDGKGRTPQERRLKEIQSRRRQKRIRQKAARALYGCRDILLVTMRKTPCLWVYHICPDFYPRFLSLRANIITVCQLFCFCFAVVVWTPCILCMELCRGFVCCISCSM